MELATNWDLSHLFADQESFAAAVKKVKEYMALGHSWEKREIETAKDLLQVCEAYFTSFRTFGPVSVFATAGSDEDTRDGHRWARKVEVQELGAKLGAAWAWLASRIVQLGDGFVEKCLAEEPALAPYAFFLRDTLRLGRHLLSPEEEKILAEFSSLSKTPYNLYQLLTHADFPFPDFSLPDGQVVKLDQNGYVRLREHQDRKVRQQACTRFFATYQAFSRTLACALDAGVRQQVTEARLRGFPSALEAALYTNAIPTPVYRQLLEQAEVLLPLLDRLLLLRKQVLALDQLRFYDLYVPWGEDSFGQVSLPQAQELLLESLAPLGDAYLEILKTGFASRWMDPFPRPGKRSGAYCAGEAYDVHPYILLNYQGNLESVATMAHEWGHAVHTALANRSQPYPTADYPIFLAEIASTLNETLLFNGLLPKLSQPRKKLFVLAHLLEHIRGTFFRQTQFADFELAIFRLVEEGGALTQEVLNQMYGERQRHWLGHSRGVVAMEEEFAVEWAYVPHFYYGFYVYQYATAITASTFFVRQILAGEPQARERYLKLLQAGGSAYPYQLLCELGVDLASPEPYQELGRFFREILEEAEALVRLSTGHGVREEAIANLAGR